MRNDPDRYIVPFVFISLAISEWKGEALRGGLFLVLMMLTLIYVNLRILVKNWIKEER